VANSKGYNLLLNFLLTSQLLPEEAVDTTPGEEDLEAYIRDLQADIERSLPPQPQVSTFYYGVSLYEQ
jgi:hypothetical protein